MIKLETINPKHNLYIVRVYNKDKSIIKLGYSSDIVKRLQRYYHHNPLIKIVDTYYREDAINFENTLHKLIPSVVMNEWYSEDKLNLIIDCVKNNIPEKISSLDYSDNNYKLIVKQYKETKSFEGFEYDVHSINVIKTTKKLYNKVWSNKSYAMHMIATYNDNYKQIGSIIQKYFKVNEIYTISKAKNILKNLYSKHSINRRAKATDLNEFFETKPVYGKSNGVTVRKIKIIKANYKINNYSK